MKPKNTTEQGQDLTADDIGTPETAAPVPVPEGPAGLDALDHLQDEETAALSETVKGSKQEQAAAAEKKELEKAAARMGASYAVGFLEGLIKTRAPYAAFPEETKDDLTDKAAAVMAKHGGAMPAWMVPYQEEVALGIALASAGFGIYVQVTAHNAAIEEQMRIQAGQGQGAGRVDLGQGG